MKITPTVALFCSCIVCVPLAESPLLDIVQSEMDNSSKGFSKAPTYLVDGRGYKFVTVQHI